MNSSFIGNKGLGFRSVLTWADEVSIFSRNLKITFSAAIAAQVMRELGVDIGQIRRERMLSETCIPFPVLGIPAVELTGSSIVGCRVEIKFKKEYIDDIERQIGNIDGKTLLFLNHVESIETGRARMQVRKQGRPDFCRRQGMAYSQGRSRLAR